MPMKKYATEEERKAARRMRDRLAYAANPEPHRARSRKYQEAQRQADRFFQLNSAASTIEKFAKEHAAKKSL